MLRSVPQAGAQYRDLAAAILGISWPEDRQNYNVI